MTIIRHVFSASNSGCLFVRRGEIILTRNINTWYYVVVTYIFPADIFILSHILLKYFANVFVAVRTDCKDIYNCIVFVVSLWCVIYRYNLGLLPCDQFLIRSFFVQRFKYCVVSFSISAFVKLVYYIQCRRMFKYYCWSIMILPLNDKMSQTFRLFVIHF